MVIAEQQQYTTAQGWSSRRLTDGLLAPLAPETPVLTVPYLLPSRKSWREETFLFFVRNRAGRHPRSINRRSASVHKF
jgi:hypothetical protein